MAHNPLSPGFVKLRYTQNLLTHVQTIPVQPSGTPTVGVIPNLVPNSGGPIDLAQFMTDYMAVLRPLFATTTAFESAEFWYQPTPESDPIWIYTHPINLAGTGGATTTSMGQLVMTFRTALGGLFRWYGMEMSTAFPVNTVTPSAAFTGTLLALSNYLKGGTSCFLARDNAKLMVAITATTKTNDALRKKRLLI